MKKEHNTLTNKNFYVLTLLLFYAFLPAAKAAEIKFSPDKRDKKIAWVYSCELYYKNCDTARYYIRGVASFFGGQVYTDKSDTMIITVHADSLDRAFYFLKKLGKVKKVKKQKKDLTNEYKFVTRQLEDIKPRYDSLRKEFLDADWEYQAIRIEKQYAPVEKELKKLNREKRILDKKLNFVRITLFLKE